MTWEWVVLILGILFLVFTFLIATMIARRETHESRIGSMFAPIVTKRTGIGLKFDEAIRNMKTLFQKTSDEGKESIESAQENNHV